MNVKKIIPCLDFKGGKVVKGVEFVELKEIGDPVELAKKYEQDGADELVFLDISATNQERKIAYEYVEMIAKAVSIPLTVGGGIRSLDDMAKVFSLGAAKVSINSAAVTKPELISESSKKFGSERIVVAIDVVKKAGKWLVVTHGGEKNSGIDALSWAKEVENRGAGSILVTSKDFDGVKRGYDLELMKALKNQIEIPLIASGGAGSLKDLEAGIRAGADAVLAASIFHYGELTVKDCKEYLAKSGIVVAGKGLEPQYDEQGLVVCIAIDAMTNKVLMQAYMNKEAWQKTIETGRATYYSRSRQKLWVKGEESGHIQDVVEILLDCDRDSVLLVVEQRGPACHTNNNSCFYTSVYGQGNTTIGERLISLQRTIKNRKENPQEGSYTNYLFEKGLDKILKKVGEETSEVIIAAKNPSKEELCYEAADLMYHLSVLLEESGLSWQDIALELESRVKD